MLTSEEINSIARKFLELKNSAIDKSSQKKYLAYQGYCVKKLSLLIMNKTGKYKNFPNYKDLQQDGFEALMLAFETYDPDKGDFIWWANKYIGTRISRAANAHSTIRVPLKKAKAAPPYKTNSMPILIDLSSPLQDVEDEQKKLLIKEAIDQLSEKHKKVILLHYEFNNECSSISSISKELNVPRQVCLKLLNEAQKSLKNKLKLLSD